MGHACSDFARNRTPVKDTALGCSPPPKPLVWSGKKQAGPNSKPAPECSLAGLMLKLKLQYFGHLMRRVDSLEKTLMLGGIEGRRRRG